MDTLNLKDKFANQGNEASILACVLQDPANCYFEAESKLRDGDFLWPHNRELWTIVKSLLRRGAAVIDISTIMNEAAELGLEKKIGGFDYVNVLFEKKVDSRNIDFYIKKLLDASTKLKLVETFQDEIEIIDKNAALTEGNWDADFIIADAQEKLTRISAENSRLSDALDLAEGIEELLKKVLNNPVDVCGLRTGFSLLDEALNGLAPGSLTVVGARPKVGKSTLLLTWAKYIAYFTGLPVLYIDTEMSYDEQRYRLVSSMSSVPERDIRKGTFGREREKEVAVWEAARILETNKNRLLHKYYPDFSAEGVASLVRKYKHQYDIGCVVFDYIKLPESDLRMAAHVKEHQSLGYLTSAFKNIAGVMNIPFITAAQINREGKGGRITSNDFADSDRILRYANTLLGLCAKSAEELEENKEKYGLDSALAMGTHRLQILDTRGGGSNYSGIDLYFRKETLTIREAKLQSFELERSKEKEDKEEVSFSPLELP